MGTVTTALAAVGIAGTLALGAMTTWNGGDALTAAKSKITQEADALGIFHTNEGRLLNKVSALKSNISDLTNQITALQQGGDASAAQIADLQSKLDKANADLKSTQDQLAQAGTNENVMAQRIDDLTAQLDKANADAATLQQTVDTTTVATSDGAAVDAAVGDTTTPPPTDTTPTDPVVTDPAPSPAPTAPTMPAGDTEVDYASVTQPHVLIYNGTTKEVQMNVVNGQVQLMNSSTVADYDYSLDGGNTWTKTPYSFVNIGSTSTIDNTEIQFKNDTTGTITKFWMVNK